jgi:hypothetical protein
MQRRDPARRRPRLRSSTARTPLQVLLVLTSYQAGTYGIFMKLSGLSQQRFAMVSLIAGTTAFATSVELHRAN